MFGSNLDSLFTLLIICGVGLYLFCLECISIQTYKNRTFRVTVKAINQLENTLPSSGKAAVIKVTDAELRSWLSRHVDGEIVNQAFHARVAKDQYIFFKWPSVLTAPPPKSIAHVAPMLLTALGILGTFIGIFLARISHKHFQKWLPTLALQGYGYIPQKTVCFLQYSAEPGHQPARARVTGIRHKTGEKFRLILPKIFEPPWC